MSLKVLLANWWNLAPSWGAIQVPQKDDVRTVLMIIYYDWFGTPEDHTKYVEATKKACEDTEGIKFKGSYVPHQIRYHYAFVYKCDDYGKMEEVNQKVQKTFPRDRNQMTHAIVEVMTKI